MNAVAEIVGAQIVPILPRADAQPRMISAVVPVFNEADNIAAFLRSLAASLRMLSPQFEIVVVNDGSADGSAAEIESVAEECQVLYLELSRNFGKEAALTAGLEATRGDCAILIDGDGQHPLSALPEMVQLWRTGYQMVYGVRTPAAQESGVRLMARQMFYRMLSRASSVPIPCGAGDFRLLDRQVVEALRKLPERNRFMKGLYAWVGFRSVAFNFQTEERSGGRSSFRFRDLFELAITGLTAFSTMPLRLVSLAGLFVSILSLAYGVYIVIEKVSGDQSLPGYATVAAAIFFFAGIQLLSLGIIGEYVGRTYTEVKRRPGYLLSRTVDLRPDAEEGAGK